MVLIDRHYSDVLEFLTCRCQYDIDPFLVWDRLSGIQRVRMSVDDRIDTGRVGDQFIGTVSLHHAVHSQMSQNDHVIDFLSDGIHRLLYLIVEILSFIPAVEIVQQFTVFQDRVIRSLPGFRGLRCGHPDKCDLRSAVVLDDVRFSCGDGIFTVSEIFDVATHKREIGIVHIRTQRIESNRKLLIADRDDLVTGDIHQIGDIDALAFCRYVAVIEIAGIDQCDVRMFHPDLVRESLQSGIADIPIDRTGNVVGKDDIDIILLFVSTGRKENRQQCDQYQFEYNIPFFHTDPL